MVKNPGRIRQQTDKIREKGKKVRDRSKEVTDKLLRKSKKLVVVGFILILITFLSSILREVISVEDLNEFILSFGVYSYLVFGVIYMVSLFIPYGTTVTTIVAGLAFGTLIGFFYVMVLSVFGSLLPFYISRRLGKDWVEAKVEEANIKNMAEKINNNAFWVLFYLRLIPSIPYELQNYMAGVSKISTRDYLLATILGLGPIVFILVYLGESLADVGGTRFWIATSIFIIALVAPPVYIFFVKLRDKHRANKLE